MRIVELALTAQQYLDLNHATGLFIAELQRRALEWNGADEIVRRELADRAHDLQDVYFQMIRGYNEK